MTPAGRVGEWVVYVDVERGRADALPEWARGSWPHWGASEDDRYRLEVWPVSEDSTAWQGISIEFGPAQVAFGDSVLEVSWDVIEDARIDSVSGLESYREHRRARAPLLFWSVEFHLPKPVPDSLYITFEMRVLEMRTGAVLYSETVRAVAVVERHRRWGIIDAIES